jgi:hypothetical protein
MANWEFEHSIFTKASRKIVWAFWSDMNNHAKMEPGIDKIELDGPFVSGTTGRTITPAYTQEWKLTEVVQGRRFITTGVTPDEKGTLSFAWDFEDEDSGMRMTHKISATGPQVEEYLDVFRAMEAGATAGMSRLAAELDRLSEEAAKE